MMTFLSVGPILAIAVTVLGFILSIVWSYILAASAKLPAQGDQPHRIKYGELELQTDRVVMLLGVCVLAMILPIALWFWLTLKGLPAQVVVVATVESSPGKFVADGEASVVRITAGGKDEIECQSQRLENGEFTCGFLVSNLAAVYELRVRTPRAAKKHTIRPTEQHAIIIVSESQ